MKKSIKIILIILGILLVVFLLTKFSLKEANKLLSENKNQEKIKAEEIKEQEVEEKTKKYSKTIDGKAIELNIPSDWNYEETKLKKDSNYKFELKLYKNSKNNNATLVICKENSLGVCGTGLTVQEMKLNNGQSIGIGYYDNSKTWTFISFKEGTGILNNGLSNIEANEILEFIKTINITTYKTIKEAKLKTNTLVKYNGILYGESGKMIDYAGGTEPVGKITKLVDSTYVPKFDNETNIKEILNALVYSPTETSIVIYYENTYKLFEKVEEK